MALFLMIIPCVLFAGGRDMVSALGFVEPQHGVLNIGGFTSSTGAIVSEVLIEEGEVVKAGQTLAILDTHKILQAALKLAEADVNIHKARLDRLKAGPSKNEIDAQQAEIERLMAEIVNVDGKYRRAETLHRKRILPEADLEDIFLKKNVLEANLRPK